MKSKGMVRFWLMVVLVGISLLPALSLQAQALAQATITLTPVADASIESEPGDANFGRAETLAVYYEGKLAVSYHRPPLQPQQVYLRAVEPREGRPGQELELTLLGGGFEDAAGVRVIIGEIEVWDAWIESNEEIIAHVFIPEDVLPGPRSVEVVAVFGLDEEVPAGLDGGFFVLEPEPTLLPFVDDVEPQQVRRDSEVELNIFGGNFLPGARVEIGGEGVLVHGVEFINADHLQAFGEVEDDAPLGWREVIVINPDEQAGGRERALEVIDDEGPTPLARPALYEVEPQEVEQGSEVELTLFGENFAEDMAGLIHGGGVEVREFHFVDPSRVIVRVAVSADAEPGPRLVELSTAGGRAELPDGLIVTEREAPPSPPPPSPPTSPISPTATPSAPEGEDSLIPEWVWASATVLLSGLSFAVGRALGLKSKLTWTDKARVQWRVEAEKKLPEPQRACQWACKANVSADLLDRWRVTKIELAPLKSKGKTPPKKCVEDKVLLAPLNDLANIGKILHREDEVRRLLAPIVDALLAQIMTWEQEGQTPASIRVEAKLEAPINAQFGLYHCGQTKEGLGWGKPRVTWKGKLNQPGGEFLGVLRGPTAEEPDFAARARRELEACLLDLVSVARFRL